MQNRNSFWTIFISACFIIACTIPVQSIAQGKKKEKKLTLATAADSFSYMIGISIGHNLKSQKIGDINIALIARGMEEVYANDSAISVQDANMYLNQFFSKILEKEGQENLEKGKKFLEENKKQPGVTETASGLQIRVIQEGTGKSPKETDQVQCHYEGRLINGDIFDSSYDRGQPAEFALQGVIKGWTEGLQLMKEGGIYELFIPSDLAYGSRGAGQSIGPNETLIFKIELLKILEPSNDNTLIPADDE
jgi:FKBP-type peptidyl-prolyl cis-trans isomerase FklB